MRLKFLGKKRKEAFPPQHVETVDESRREFCELYSGRTRRTTLLHERRTTREERPEIGRERLSEVEKKQMTKLIGEFPMLTRLQPGKTHVIEHRNNTDAQGPVRQRAYRIPPALKTEVVEELKQLLDAGVVEESTSEWSSPIDVVKKKDRTNRICVDYRKLKLPYSL